MDLDLQKAISAQINKFSKYSSVVDSVGNEKECYNLNSDDKISYGSIKDLYECVLWYYKSSGRDDLFVKTLYKQDSLYNFYAKNKNPIQHVVVVSSIYDLPFEINTEFVKKHNIFVMVLYFDDIKYYEMSKYAYRKKNTKNSKKDLVDFINYKNLNVNDSAKTNVEKHTFFSNNINMPHCVDKILGKFSSQEYFNIINLLNVNRKECKEKIKNFLQYIYDLNSVQ